MNTINKVISTASHRALGIFLGCVLFSAGGLLPAYGQVTNLDEQDADCVTGKATELHGGCVLEYEKLIAPADYADVGADSVANGEDAIVKGLNSLAIGKGAEVGEFVPRDPGSEAQPGVYTITLYNPDGTVKGDPSYQVTTDTPINVGEMNELDLVAPNGDDPDGDGNPDTVTHDGTQPGFAGRIDIVTVTTPKPLVDPTPAQRNPAENALAVGVGAKVTGDDGTAVGFKATAGEGGTAVGSEADAGEGGIAIGAGVTAGANQIVIGDDQVDYTKVEVGGIDLAGIATNAGGIADNTAAINTNTASIASNSDDIETNRSGIAMAVALAHLPLIEGPRGGWAIAGGSFDGESAVAIGANWNVGTNKFIKLGVANSNGESSFGAGFGMGF